MNNIRKTPLSMLKVKFETVFSILNYLFNFRAFRRVINQNRIKTIKPKAVFYFSLNRLLNLFDKLFIMGYQLITRKYRIPINPELIHNKDKKISFLYNIFSELQLIGRGKDGEVYIAKSINNNKKQIVKVLSFYGLKFLPLTKKFASLNIDSKYLYKIEILNNFFIKYPYEKLSMPNSLPLDFLDQLIMISKLEIALIKNKLVYLDFSNKHHINYLIDVNENLKIIDYTGGSLYYIDSHDTRFKFNRINLITAKNRFVQTKLLMHIYNWGLGRKGYKGKIQDSYLEVFKFLELCQKAFFGTVYYELFNFIKNNDLLKIRSWKNLIKVIERTKLENKYFLMESADIDKVIVKNGQIKVTGYQNYVISIKDKKIIPIKGNTELWRTDQKYELIIKALNIIKEFDIEIKSFIDIGSNLGLYVFAACLIYGIPKCIGVDYNSEYIEKTNLIKELLKIENCHFELNKFEDLNEKYDCIVAVGLIHHLYHRTESYGSLEPIIKKFSDLTNKALVIEFPTEHDEKAKKWTDIPGRKKLEKYKLSNFLKYTDKYFNNVIKVGKIGNTRLMYLLLK